MKDPVQHLVLDLDKDPAQHPVLDLDKDPDHACIFMQLWIMFQR